MKISKLTIAVISMTAIFLMNCANQSDRKGLSKEYNIIMQKEDGTIPLKLEEASCYFNIAEPSANTAEWNIIISKPGRYKVWLSSATKDTLVLDYKNNVKVSLLDSSFEIIPACDKIVPNSDEVNSPYYRADSYMGSLYISEPGEYRIQLISEKVIPMEMNKQTASLSGNTKLMSVYLVPMTR